MQRPKDGLCNGVYPNFFVEPRGRWNQPLKDREQPSGILAGPNESCKGCTHIEICTSIVAEQAFELLKSTTGKMN